ncbi:hypothetical protein SAMN05216582_13114 [Selenomonas ruminantium]|uniref:Uncharacterized protein n=1 Tax=Selenomonas ruminantium TaxID=971 RepID=A0A1M6X435_SELRU|nr:hypothetical protein [Selenomonas ruminantium]SHL00545.1 hypothetical protein SAMN05216582_13114 [Selenomonas ruminantium]
MEKEDNSTVKSLRAPQDTFEKLKAIAADNQLGSQGEALTALIRLWEVNKAKVAVPDRATEIETFRSYLNKIEDAYIHSLEINVAAEDRIREHFAGRLEADNTLINSLQEAKKNLMEQEKVLKDAVEEYKLQLVEQENDLRAVSDSKKSMEADFVMRLQEKDQQLADKETLIATLTKKSSADEQRIKELEDELLAGDDYQKKIAELTAQLNDANAKIAILQSNCEHLQKTSELNIQAARLEAQQEAQEKIAKLQDSIAERFSKLERF